MDLIQSGVSPSFAIVINAERWEKERREHVYYCSVREVEGNGENLPRFRERQRLRLANHNYKRALPSHVLYIHSALLNSTPIF